MHDLMIDIETLATEPNAAILSIGAVFFEPATGITGPEFDRRINLESNVQENRKMSPSTIKWWMTQSDNARAGFGEGGELCDVLLAFRHWLAEHSTTERVLPWGNGANFDTVLLEAAFRQCGIRVPWRFYNVRDVRTVCELAAHLGMARGDFEFKGVKHNALDDAKHQAKYVSAMYQKLIGKG